MNDDNNLGWFLAGAAVGGDVARAVCANVGTAIAKQSSVQAHETIVLIALMSTLSERGFGFNRFFSAVQGIRRCGQDHYRHPT